MKTTPTELYTEATNLSFRTDHTSSLQKISLNNESLDIHSVGEEFAYRADGPLSLAVPMSDVAIKANGYISFSKEAYFTPTQYKIIPIKNSTDIEDLDYVITNYRTPEIRHGSAYITSDFKLANGWRDKNKLDWLIKTPTINNSGQRVTIKGIQVHLTKKGWVKKLW